MFNKFKKKNKLCLNFNFNFIKKIKHLKYTQLFKKKKKKKSKFRENTLLTYLVIKDLFMLGMTIGFIVTGILIIWMVNLKIPDFNSLNDMKVTESTKIYDRTGEILLYDVHEDIKRTLVSHESISPYIINASVAIEDSEFYNHIGIRPISFLRSVLANLKEGSFSQGGSTITQQLVKNTLLTPEKKISRKLKEWVIAVKLEREYSKEQILTLYLNEAPYGGNLYGVEEASQAFFDKHALDLTLAESAYLAALPQAPTFFSPYGNNTDRLEARKELVLNKMYEQKYITGDEFIKAIDEVVEFKQKQGQGILAPHFVTWVREELVQKFGERAVLENGYRVITTIDMDLQKHAEDSVTKFGEQNVIKYNATNAGMIGLDPQTGEVLLMVGSRDYFNIENEGNFNVTLAENRQPGSTFKPFVYAASFIKGYTPDTIVFDLETQFQTTCDAEGKPLSPEDDPDECYTPRNYDNVFRGPMTLRDALAQSVNIPAVKVLYLTGMQESLDLAKKMGVKGLTNTNQYGLTLVLGGGEVSLLGMTSAYGVFANNGIKHDPINILRIENSKGDILEEQKQQPKGERVIPKEVALQISDILSDNKARTPAFGSRSFLYFENDSVAVKTGTTNDYKDAWIIGYTPNFVLGTWVGNNNNASMEKKVAGFIVAPMWNEVMNYVLSTTTQETFQEPQQLQQNTKPVFRGLWQGNLSYVIDTVSGLLATKDTPGEFKQEKIIRDIHNILHWVNKKDPHGPIPSKPMNDSQYELWEVPVQKWVTLAGFSTSTDSIPTKYDNVHTDENKPDIKITSIDSRKPVKKYRPIAIFFDIESNFPLESAEYYFNNRYIGSSKYKPFIYSFIPNEMSDLKEENVIRVDVLDSAHNKGTDSVILKVILD